MYMHRPKNWLDTKLDEELKKLEREGRSNEPMEASEMAKRLGCSHTYVNDLIRPIIKKLRANLAMQYLFLVYIQEYEFDLSEINQDFLNK